MTSIHSIAPLSLVFILTCAFVLLLISVTVWRMIAWVFNVGALVMTMLASVAVGTGVIAMKAIGITSVASGATLALVATGTL